MESIISIEEAEIYFDGTLSEPRLSHPEGLAFDREGNLWCGGDRGEIYKIDSEGKSIELVAKTGGFSLGMAFDRQDQLYVCDLKYASVFRLNTKTNELVNFSKDSVGAKMRVPNFPVFDHKRNCLYISDSYGSGQKGPGIWKINLETGEGYLWYKETMNFANGMALSPDGDSLFVIETFARKVSSIEIKEDGQHGDKQEVARLNALPDGLSVDTDGNLFVTCYEPSQLYRVNVNGDVELLIKDPEAHTLCHPTNCAFRDDELFTTNLGRWHITKFKVGVNGVALI